jgi:hypothetical protein
MVFGERMEATPRFMRARLNTLIGVSKIVKALFGP